MAMFKTKSIEEKQFTEIVDSLCKKLSIDKSVALHFINNDLTRIRNNIIVIDNIKLSKIENEIETHNKKEAELNKAIEEKETLLKKHAAKIESLSNLLREKNASLAKQEDNITLLQTKLDDLLRQIKNNEKEMKILDYDVMMKNHEVKEASDNFSKYLKIFLSIMTVIVVIVFVLLNYRR